MVCFWIKCTDPLVLFGHLSSPAVADAPQKMIHIEDFKHLISGHLKIESCSEHTTMYNGLDVLNSNGHIIHWFVSFHFSFGHGPRADQSKLSFQNEKKNDNNNYIVWHLYLCVILASIFPVERKWIFKLNLDLNFRKPVCYLPDKYTIPCSLTFVF